MERVVSIILLMCIDTLEFVIRLDLRGAIGFGTIYIFDTEEDKIIIDK